MFNKTPTGMRAVSDNYTDLKKAFLKKKKKKSLMLFRIQ